VCFFRSTIYVERQCAELDGYYSRVDKYCYYNGSVDYGSDCRYFVNRKCYQYVASSYTASTCANIDGFFTTSGTTGESGNFCYYRQLNCTFHPANNQCYTFKTPVYNRSECDVNGGYYQHGYCYNECPVSKFLIGDICYDFRAVTTPRKCAELRGYFNESESYCYYGKRCISGYMVNGECYQFLESGYTASTCANIGGYFSTLNKQGQSGQFCYFEQFNCTFHVASGQCYRVKSAVGHPSECDSMSGFYRHGYCYYECPNNKYLIKDKCYDTRSAQYSQYDCQAVGGLYVDSYCYVERCNYSLANNHCYRYRTASYSNGTCFNIGGYYAAETVPPYQLYCYYTSFDCRYHAVNGQCYSRSSNHSSTVCKTIPDGYFDFSSSTCYYYCTWIPELRQCFVTDSPVFTIESCAVIGGIYANSTCYYVTAHCPMHGANNGQCYSNRSADLTCSTCQNIGGHYENGSCFFYQNNCSAYSIDGQCYSTRSLDYSTSSCNDIGGFYRNGYCYYEASRCRNAYYRNCRCFRYNSTSKTAETCANIGGYYDPSGQRCFYNLSSCPHYDRNGQCYKYMTANFSRSTCLAIGGYYSQERDEFWRYSYICYFHEANCSHWLNGECYASFSSSFNEGTCHSIEGYYSQNHHGCYYNTFLCAHPKAGQCYDVSRSGWSKSDCDEANGYYEYWRRCYTSNYYCPHVVASRNKCYFYTSASSDVCLCRLRPRGFVNSGMCYYSSANCTSPLFLASNGLCYENRTTTGTEADCSSMPGEAFYNKRDSVCYFSLGSCSLGHYVNCSCYNHRSDIYTAGTCRNFGGYYTNDRCYYNSSQCPDSYHSINEQCYRHSSGLYTPSTCVNIGGYYDYPSTVDTISGTCYYNSFNCSGFVVDGRYCFMDRSAASSRTTCRNIGGIYAYLSSGRDHRSAGSYIYSYRTYYCLYDIFNCSG